MSKKIVSGESDSQMFHRNDFTHCPHCDHEMQEHDWDDAATTLALHPRCYKAGSVSVVSECPKCFKSSYVHHRMECFGYSVSRHGKSFPVEWSKAVENLKNSLLEAATKQWAESLCSKCKRLYGEPAPFNNWRHCIVGIGPPETECSKFKPTPTPDK